MIKLIDYKAGNSPSFFNAVKHLGFDAELVNSAEQLKDATHIILPGVGSAKATMDSLRELNLIDELERLVLQNKVRFLGVCVGLQILFQHSEEENTECLGWLKGNVVKFDEANVRVPQMGWNEVKFVKDAGFPAQDGHFYFVNSYHAKLDDSSDLWGKSDYNGEFTAAINRDNIYATQFHIEKSGEAGLAMLKKFLKN